MADTYITVKAPREEGVSEDGPFHTVLWEKDALHPHKPNEDVGEVFIVTDGKEHRVGETAAVEKLLMSKRLVKASEARSATPSVPAVPRTESKPA